MRPPLLLDPATAADLLSAPTVSTDRVATTHTPPGNPACGSFQQPAGRPVGLYAKRSLSSVSLLWAHLSQQILTNAATASKEGPAKKESDIEHLRTVHKWGSRETIGKTVLLPLLHFRPLNMHQDPLSMHRSAD